MKKIYIAPETVDVKIETANMIALSGNLDSTKSIDSYDDFGSRGSGGWDWDEEE